MSTLDATREALELELRILRQRVSELQRQRADWSDARGVERIAGVDLTVSEREALLVEAERISHTGSWVWNIETQEVVWSDELFRILGYDPALDRASIEGFFSAVHPEDRDRVRETSSRGVSSGVTEQVDFRVLHANGAVRFTRMNGAMLFDEHGTLRRVVGTVVDITEQRLLHERVVQVQKMEAVSRLAGGIAHDFNNLLTVIQANLELHQRDRERDLGAALHALESARSLTGRLLALGRRSMLQRRTLDLNRLVEGTRQLLQRVIGENVRLALVLDAREPKLDADPSLLEQALVNLVLNARDALRDGGEIRVGTRLVDEDGAAFVELSVSDDGEGMDESTRARVFEPFFTTKPEGRGTGLGLAMVQGTVEQHGGSLHVDSAPGRGSAFHLRFPAAADGAVPTHDAPAHTTPAAAPRTILVIEDNEMVSTAVRQMLECDGHRVLLAGKPLEARAHVEREGARIDLILCDVVMPERRGPDVIRDLRALNPGLPRPIYMSGYPSPNADLVDAAGLLPKPFTAGELRDALRRALEGSATPSA